MHNNSKRNQRLRILNILLVCWIACIWIQSMIPAYASSEESHFVGQFVEPVLELFFGKGAVIDFIVRKLAHFTEYAILGILMGVNLLERFHQFGDKTIENLGSAATAEDGYPYGAACERKGEYKYAPKAKIDLYHWSYVLLLVLAVAVIDESIQLITPGRGSQVKDVLIDTAGGFTGIVLVNVVYRIRTAVRKRKNR